ncbi:MAG: hypothetical protein KF805_16060 [Phycisphaeraceae bacterium]|nr:hypothetical protein [Phycisphaeraceae bacterium]
MSWFSYSFLDVRAALSRLVVNLMQQVCRNRLLATAPRLAPNEAVFFGTKGFSVPERVVPWHLCNANCPPCATARGRVFGSLLGFLAMLASAAAQDTIPKHPDGEERHVAAITQDLLRTPEPKLMMEAFGVLRDWIDTWSVAASPDATKLGNSTGVICLTLRYGGRIIGRSVQVGGPDALERAARDAMRDAGRFFGEKGKPENASRITISLEASGALIPYQPSSYDDTDLEIPAGIDGVGARVGEGEHQKLRVAFPSMMLTFGYGADRSVGSGGQSPGDALASCAANVLEDPTVGIRGDVASDPEKLMRDRKVTFYRFEVSHLAQISPVEAPQFLYRNGKVVQERDVHVAAMKTWADGLTAHLLSRIAIHENGALVSGLYSPVSGACIPRAEIAEESLIALALARAADSGVLTADAAARARDAARAVVRDLSARDDEKRRIERSPIASAAFMLTLQLLALDAPEAQPALLAARKEVREILEGPVRSPSVSSLAAWAASGAEPRAEMTELSGRAVAAVFRAAPVEKLATAMPWIIMAARATEPSGEIASTVVLDQWRDLVFKFVMRPQDAGADGEDLVGGIVFTGSRAPLPSAQSLRVIAGLAAMLNDDRLTPPDKRPQEIARLVPCLRFVRQLMGDEYNGTMFVDPLRSEWGVRNSMWDQRMSGEAGALALITLCEAVEGAQRSR